MEVATVRSYGRLRACMDGDAGHAAQAPILGRMRMYVLPRLLLWFMSSNDINQLCDMAANCCGRVLQGAGILIPATPAS